MLPLVVGVVVAGAVVVCVVVAGAVVVGVVVVGGCIPVFSVIQAWNLVTRVFTDGLLGCAHGMGPKLMMPCSIQASLVLSRHTNGPPESPCKHNNQLLVMTKSDHTGDDFYCFSSSCSFSLLPSFFFFLSAKATVFP